MTGSIVLCFVCFITGKYKFGEYNITGSVAGTSKLLVIFMMY